MESPTIRYNVEPFVKLGKRLHPSILDEANEFHAIAGYYIFYRGSLETEGTSFPISNCQVLRVWLSRRVLQSIKTYSTKP